MKPEERKLKILEAIVDLYVETGEPVGSKALCDYLDFSVSSATIRNDMAEFCDLGFLEKIHTSSGRVPSDRGYRLYVNKLMNRKDLSHDEKIYILSGLSSCRNDPERLLSKASELLSEITNFAAVSTSPPTVNDTVRKIEFVQTGRKSAMLIFMTSLGIIKNKLFRSEYDLTPEVLNAFANIANEKFVGLNVSMIDTAFIQGVAASLGEMALLMPPVLNAVLDAASESINVSISMMGQTNLLFLPEFDTDNAKSVMEFLNHQDNIVDLLLSNQRNRTNVLIGPETNRPELENFSVVISHYNLFNNVSGAIAIIGPKRMDYSKIITSLEYLSSSVGNILSEILDS